MSLYVDSALLAEVARVRAAFPVAGVTTNPSILLAAISRGQRLDDVAVLRGLLDLLEPGGGSVFMQPVGATADDLQAMAARYLDTNADRVVLKLPMTAPGLAAGTRLLREGARVAFTAASTSAQAYCAAAAGAGWVIPYFGRLRRAGLDPCERIAEMARVVYGQNAPTRILAASLKTTSDVMEATLAGARDFTAPPAVIEGLLADQITEDAILRFEDDWAAARRALTATP
ncbi:MAG TPA: transaldolase family protein [Ktedonobacterales bacterium]